MKNRPGYKGDPAAEGAAAARLENMPDSRLRLRKIEKFHVITHPTPVSTLGDICFETDWIGLELQFRGGLKASDIYAVYGNKDDAWTAAARLLSAYQDYQKKIDERG